MEDGYGRLIRQFTSVTLVTGVLLVGLGVAGYTPSLVFALSAAVLAGVALAVRDRLLRAAPYRVLAIHAESLWIGPALAAGVLIVYSGISPGELQTVGAVIGLLGMANYLLRPVYVLVASIAGRVAQAV
jgi:hypothetical protein